MGLYLQFLSLQMTQSFAGQWVMIRKWTYCGKTYEECSDGHRTGKCCLIWKSALLCTWERETIIGKATVGILHPGMESIPETGYGKTGESTKKSHKMIQGYKYLSYEERLIRCGLTTLEKRRTRGDLIEAYKIITGKESMQSESFFELAPSKVTRGHRYKLFKKRKGTLGQKFVSARVVDLWNALDDSTVSVDNVTAFKRKLGKLGRS